MELRSYPTQDDSVTTADFGTPVPCTGGDTKRRADQSLGVSLMAFALDFTTQAFAFVSFLRTDLTLVVVDRPLV